MAVEVLRVPHVAERRDHAAHHRLVTRMTRVDVRMSRGRRRCEVQVVVCCGFSVRGRRRVLLMSILLCRMLFQCDLKLGLKLQQQKGNYLKS